MGGERKKDGAVGGFWEMHGAGKKKVAMAD